mmetsp:Transcript_21337/g.46614  ORF Transcript_21337/g.46614 Transcript_21337/m.46614 type:complete len:451 (-) Transcript_21337:1611-2963(-)|eukprot:CAMPEP_0202915140 /NCGR_PEP_ID=MMETSP1392-20130828/64910_1 /ASSEMBLY_ACC=CAM_ASM_000868 /TAXON_ID=225041 /ORGANISM="Chlamydomonas chlamydogama, Strain SAG 11-48b" /LENGTH=450 /DNA_ID=CAMNT_0049607045 /DNA_START=96 /DNA_END=1448 /DNA_ORIENTATION=+
MPAEMAHDIAVVLESNEVPTSGSCFEHISQATAEVLVAAADCSSIQELPLAPNTDGAKKSRRSSMVLAEARTVRNELENEHARTTALMEEMEKLLGCSDSLATRTSSMLLWEVKPCSDTVELPSSTPQQRGAGGNVKRSMRGSLVMMDTGMLPSNLVVAAPTQLGGAEAKAVKGVADRRATDPQVGKRPSVPGTTAAVQNNTLSRCLTETKPSSAVTPSANTHGDAAQHSSSGAVPPPALTAEASSGSIPSESGSGPLVYGPNNAPLVSRSLPSPTTDKHLPRMTPSRSSAGSLQPQPPPPQGAHMTHRRASAVMMVAPPRGLVIGNAGPAPSAKSPVAGGAQGTFVRNGSTVMVDCAGSGEVGKSSMRLSTLEDVASPQGPKSFAQGASKRGLGMIVGATQPPPQAASAPQLPATGGGAAAVAPTTAKKGFLPNIFAKFGKSGETARKK